MSTAIKHSWYMTVRQLRALARQPVWIAISIVQPIIWIVLYGKLFGSITKLGGFGTTNYLAYLTPGIVIMTVLFSGGWSGMGLIEDIDRGVVDRFLVTPVTRGALIAGRLVMGALVALIQSAILIVIGVLLGARFDNPLGLLIVVLAGILLGAAFGSLSNAMAVVVRKEETVIAAVNFVILPLTFLSSVFIVLALTPGWIQGAATVNPVNWAVVAGRDALTSSPDWGMIGLRLLYLVVFAAACGWLAIRAFRAYQRSV